MEKSIALSLLATLTLLNAVFAQDSTFLTTSTGLLYKIYSDKREAPVRDGDFLKYHVLETLHDSVLMSTYDNMPVYTRVGSAHNSYSAAEIFPLLRKGDRALVVMPAADIQQHMGGQLPGFLRKTDSIYITFKVLEVFRSNKEREADSAQEVTGQQAKETQTIEFYLALHHISAEKTPMGTYIVIENPGSGPAITSGKQVAFHYTCRALHGSKIVPSNQLDSENAPLTAVIGTGKVIVGVEDGLRHLRAGGKATLYVPAFLGYDSMRGPGGSTFEDLIFDIEVDKVTAAPISTH
jgi:FKBP-type peptidyl-prolyl cis-trans isomerase FkpA